MEYWVWRNKICFYLAGASQKIKSDHHPLLIPNIPLFHHSIIPSRCKRLIRHSQSPLTWPSFRPRFQPVGLTGRRVGPTARREDQVFNIGIFIVPTD
jgi:hypothetical protein